MPKYKRCYWDASTWIALLSNLQTNQAIEQRWHCKQLFQEAIDGEIQLLTSAITITEVLRGETQADAYTPSVPIDIKEQIDALFNEPYIVLVPLDPARAQEARDLRWKHSWLRTVDAIHIASAIYAQADVLHTYDGSGGRSRRMLQLDGQEGSPPLPIKVPFWEGQATLSGQPNPT